MSYTSHLASRGYVVLSTDHPGRSLADLLPCLFLPPLDGCEIAVDDPAPADLLEVLEWISAGDHAFAEVVDIERIALTGHSAGGASTTTLGDADLRFDALVPMAGADAVTRDVPVLSIGGDCDGVVPLASIEEAAASSTDADLVVLEGAGHLAFSDLCALDFGAVGAQFEDRDDLSSLFFDSLIDLGTDGCPGRAPAPEVCGAGSYLAVADGYRVLHGEATSFLDRTLR